MQPIFTRITQQTKILRIGYTLTKEKKREVYNYFSQKKLQLLELRNKI